MVIDVIDGSDLRFLGSRPRLPKRRKKVLAVNPDTGRKEEIVLGPLPRRPKRRREVKEEIDSVWSLIAELKEAGGDPIIVYGMSNALGYVVDRVIERAHSHGMLSLLRFHGHGAPGGMSIAGAYYRDMSAHLADLGPKKRRIARRILADLRPYFSPSGRVELHGCEVGKGRAGLKLLRWMANTLGVPVSAGVSDQWSGAKGDFTFEGPVRTVYPGGRVIKTSSRAIPGGYCGV